MAKKYMLFLLLINLLMGVAAAGVQERHFLYLLCNSDKTAPLPDEAAGTVVEVMSRGPRISGKTLLFELQSIQRQKKTVLCEEDRQILYKIVEAEAGTEDRLGKIMVANVIMNRLEDDDFPDTIKEIVFQQENGVTQFSPVANGSFDKALPKEETIEAVNAALEGEDYSKGALYFVAREYADATRLEWFDECLTKVTEHGGHEFYR